MKLHRNRRAKRGGGGNAVQLCRAMILACGMSVLYWTHQSESSSLLLVQQPRHTSLSQSNQDCCALARQESLGFFQDIPDATWRRQQARARRTSLFMMDDSPQHQHSTTAAFLHKPHRWYFRNLQPDFSCPHVERIGVAPHRKNKNDARWTCDPDRLLTKQPQSCLIYSIAHAKSKLHWEQDMVERYGHVCEIHILYPGATSGIPKTWNVTQQQPPSQQFQFHDATLRSSAGPTQGNHSSSTATWTFAQMVQRLGHQNRRTLDILKLDCGDEDACEWTTFSDWILPPPLAQDVPQQQQQQELVTPPIFQMIRQLLLTTNGLPVVVVPAQQQEHQHNPPADALTLFTALRHNGYAMFAKEPDLQVQGANVHFGFVQLHPAFFG
eukprot:CAMPEP_0172472754 /NCGR_PEP_ID=MMETSP1065-20121228/68506_1 /TAXON_ID=265537 /ORGANISM="Amphiprora paludosa, Strain CCMP125" /LENGTH=381 /DNA_ID=CAMNT_0013230915 /DNA_START=509 /DNA_END=1654 /DNA_ORIENTATION=-